MVNVLSDVLLLAIFTDKLTAKQFKERYTGYYTILYTENVQCCNSTRNTFHSNGKTY